MTNEAAAPSGAAMDRRSFLQLGLAGSAMLGAAGFTATLAGCSGKPLPPAKGYYYLRDADVVLFTALIPQLLKSLPMDAATPGLVLRGIDGACFLADTPAQAEVRKLLDLLNTGFLRRLTTGVNVDWSQATPEQIEAFLQRWRESSMSVFNAGYRVLAKLASVPYFCLPQSRAVSGYPGPLASMYQAVNS